MPTTKQALLFEVGEARRNKASSSTFVKNMSLPVHRWFRYSAGFSAAWARELIEAEKQKGRHRVLDPFAGSGTVPLEAESAGLESIGLDAHPFVARVAQAKLEWHQNADEFVRRGDAVLDAARKLATVDCACPPLISKCFRAESLDRLYRIRKSWAEHDDGSPLSRLTWLAVISIIRDCSPVGTANWQYVLPKKSKARVADPYDAFAAKIRQMKDDMVRRQSEALGPKALLVAGDARDCAAVATGWADLVVTSPPYSNNFDYADATRLEMTFMGEINGWGDLQDKVRRHLVRSCSQHVPEKAANLDEVLATPPLEPIRGEISAVCRELATVRLSKGGKKTYHLMIACYFLDMAKMWHALRRCCSSPSTVCFVIGDSAPYGVYVPVIDWLGKLAIAAGFKQFRFEKTRERNTKWKNRKHRVPLCEGRLWVDG